MKSTEENVLFLEKLRKLRDSNASKEEIMEEVDKMFLKITTKEEKTNFIDQHKATIEIPK